MKDNQIYIQRAIYNKRTNHQMVQYLKTMSFEELTEPISICINGKIKDGMSIFDIFYHITYIEVFLYQTLHEKNLKAKFDDSILNLRLNKDVIPSLEEFTKAINILSEIDQQFITFFKTLDLSSFDSQTYEFSNTVKECNVSVLIEQLLAHSIHHRGQISQLLSMKGIGEDFSRFNRFGYEI